MLKVLVISFLTVSTLLSAVTAANIDAGQRIINGENAAPGQFPWAGVLTVGLSLCSCSLVHTDWVLTAGNCVHHTNTGSVYFGDPRRGGSGEIHRNFVQVILHPNYAGGGSNDLAMLRLESPYQLSGTIQTIALPEHEGQWFENQWGYITGFGIIAPGQLPEVMQFAEMRALSRDECNEQWPDQAGYFICAYSGVSTSCSGDSGGGFAIFDNGAWRLVGSASMGRTVDGQCDVTWSSGYVRVAQHANWIRSVMA